MAAKVFAVGDVLPAGLIEISVTNHHNNGTKNNIEERGLKSDNNLFNFFTIVPIDDPEDPDLMYEYYIADIWFGHCYMYYNDYDEEEYDCGFSWSVVIDTSDWSLSKRTISSVKWSSYNYGVYFNWQEIQRYSITFEENGGTSVTDLTEQTALPNPLPIPTKDNHSFLGWYYDSDFTTQAIANDEITENVILYAKWELNTYTITYNSNGGSNVSQATGVTTLPSTLPTTTKANNVFAGWYLDSSFTQKANAGDALANDVTLYAKWYSVSGWFSDVADAIREKDGTVETIEVVDFADRITALPSPKEEETKTITPDFAGGNQVITPTTGKVLNQVTLTKPADLIPENIAKDKNVCGVVGTSFIAIELTQAQYDTLSTKDSNTYYLIVEEA